MFQDNTPGNSGIGNESEKIAGTSGRESQNIVHFERGGLDMCWYMMTGQDRKQRGFPYYKIMRVVVSSKLQVSERAASDRGQGVSH